MMTGSSQYDPELQMFVDKQRELDPNRLCFLRWLAEQGRLEQGPQARRSIAAAKGGTNHQWEKRRWNRRNLSS
jgi:hypothetical protein